MRFKIVVANREAPIGEDEIPKALLAFQKGEVAVLRHVIFNPSYFQLILPDEKASRNNANLKDLGYNTDKKTSEFAKVLSPKMKMLSNKKKLSTEALDK